MFTPTLLKHHQPLVAQADVESERGARGLAASILGGVAYSFVLTFGVVAVVVVVALLDGRSVQPTVLGIGAIALVAASVVSEVIRIVRDVRSRRTVSPAGRQLEQDILSSLHKRWND